MNAKLLKICVENNKNVKTTLADKFREAAEKIEAAAKK